MSNKRQAETQLNHDNWDQEDLTEQEEDGGFKMAPKEVLDKRVIRTAKRRSQATSDVVQKPVFSGFGGFNKIQKTSFDFLSNLTNGSKTNNESSTLKNESETVSSNTLTTNPANSPSSSIFSLPGSSPSNTNAPLSHSTAESAIFGGTGSIPPLTQSIFSSSKPETTVNDSPFKSQFSAGSASNTNFGLKPSSNVDKPSSQASSSLFGVTSPNTNINTTPFSSKINNNIEMKTPATASSPKSTEINKPVSKSVKDDKDLMYYSSLKCLNESVSAWIKKHVDETPLCILSPIFKDYETHLQDIQDKYKKSTELAPLKTVSDTNENNKDTKNPLTTLSSNTTGSTFFTNSSAPVKSIFSLTPNTTSSTVEKKSNFSFGNNTPTTTSSIVEKNSNSTFGNNTPTTTSLTVEKNSNFSFGNNTPTNTGSIVGNNSNFTFGNNTQTNTSLTVEKNSNFTFGTNTSTSPSSTVEKKNSFIFGNKAPTTTSPANEKISSFSFGNHTPITTSATSFATSVTPSTGYSFGIKQSTSPFAANTTVSGNNATTPFSFGIGKPFAFNSNIKKSDEPTNQGDDNNEDEPPKVEYTPIAEENSVYDKKCKVFVKKDGIFIDKGVATLYIKKIEETGKYQLLVRANTSLGNVLINMILSSSLPTQRMGKNNVMMVCMPTPDAKPPPTSILIRVKTSEDADELLGTLDKYKA